MSRRKPAPWARRASVIARKYIARSAAAMGTEEGQERALESRVRLEEAVEEVIRRIKGGAATHQS